MRIQVAVPEQQVDQPVLDAALEAVTRLNESLIENGNVPLFGQALNRIRWQPEPPGQECFDHAQKVLERGHGDCDDLAPWHAASLRATGQDPGAAATVYQSGPNRWHAVVQRSDGTLEDPSAAAGMPTHSGIRPASTNLSVAGCEGAVIGAYLLRPQISLRPRFDGGWLARADLPWQWRQEIMHGEPSPTDWAMATLHSAPVASTALVGAIMGAVELAEAADAGDPDHIARLCCLAHAAQGIEFDELEDEYGTEHAAAATHVVGGMYQGLRGQLVGFGWSDALDIAKVALPIASTFIPGVGPIVAPIAAAAMQAIPSGGGGRPAAASYAAPAPVSYAAPQGYAPQAMPASYGPPMSYPTQGGRICFPYSWG